MTHFIFFALFLTVSLKKCQAKSFENEYSTFGNGSIKIKPKTFVAKEKIGAILRLRYRRHFFLILAPLISILTIEAVRENTG